MALLDEKTIEEMRKPIHQLEPVWAAKLHKLLSKTSITILAGLAIQNGWHTKEFLLADWSVSCATIVYIAFSLANSVGSEIAAHEAEFTNNMSMLKTRSQLVVAKLSPSSSEERVEERVEESSLQEDNRADDSVKVVNPVHSMLDDVVRDGKVICITSGSQSEIDRVVCGLFKAGQAIKPYERLVIMSRRSIETRGNAYGPMEQEVPDRFYSRAVEPPAEYLWPNQTDSSRVFVVLDVLQSRLKMYRSFIKHCRKLDATIVVACCDKMVSTSVLCRSYVDVFGILRSASIFLDGLPEDTKAIMDIRSTLVERDGDGVFVTKLYEDACRHRFVSGASF
jgi:hypothetical protein